MQRHIGEIYECWLVLLILLPLHSHLMKGFLIRSLASAIQRAAFTSNIYEDFVHDCLRPRLSQVCGVQFKLFLQKFSTGKQCERLPWEGSSHDILLRKLEVALKNHQVHKAWESFHDFKSLYGYPAVCLVNQLIIQMSYSSDHTWPCKACDLVLQIAKEKSFLLQADTLTKLTLSLARLQMPVSASMILRVMLETEFVPYMKLLSLVFLHMVKTEIGTHLATNYLVQVCDCFKSSSKKSHHDEKAKPDTMIFNLVLDACVRFKFSLKAQYMYELIPETGTVADAHSIVIISQILEMNGLRNEMKELKTHIDHVSTRYVHHYHLFYDSLLSLHFKFNDIDSAAKLVLDMNGHRYLPMNKEDSKQSQAPYFVAIGSRNLKNGLKMEIEPQLLQKDFVLEVEGGQDLIFYRDGKLILSNRALAEFISRYKKAGRISELSKLLLSIQGGLFSLAGSGLCADVIGAFIQFGWLESAHDIIDDIEAFRCPLGRDTYISLLAAYHKEKMHREANALLKQMKKVGLDINLSDNSTGIDIKCAGTSDSPSKSDLAITLAQVLKDEERTVFPMVYEFNSSIYFFCKARMIEDMLRTYRRMEEMNIQPTAQTFAYMLSGYSSLGMYREITILWGDIKRLMRIGNLVANRDLFELLLLNFLRGGYFERVMEVIGFLGDHNMYTDKWMYKFEFLRHHKNLYRSLRASNVRTEAQSKRLEYVRAFRKWVGID